VRRSGVIEMDSSATVASERSTFATAVADSLARRPRQLPTRYLYDALGSALFDAICRLPWYRVTRAEAGLLEEHADAILAPLVRPVSVVELGCGNGEKLAALIEHAREPVHRAHLVDISAAALVSAHARVSTVPGVLVTTFEGTYEDGLAGLSAEPHDGGCLALFLDSNIGNFDPEAARGLLRRLRGSLGPGDALLIGTDLVKPERDLQLAYDDPLGVTAAFNRNLLRRVNEELDGDFDLDGFVHRAVWSAAERRVEMRLVSTRRQRVRIAAADLDIAFEPDEWIWTESSYKYEPEVVLREGREAGFAGADQWIDQHARFALTRFTV
jgi:dimethylhistidine N-methyltransferase